jgi:hypothetical protein
MDVSFAAIFWHVIGQEFANCPLLSGRLFHSISSENRPAKLVLVATVF